MDFFDVVIFSAIMGLSIYGSYPIVLKKDLKEILSKALIAVAVGIMIFLLADFFSDASQILYNGSLYGYGSSPLQDAIFSLSLIAGFFMMKPISTTRAIPASPISTASDPKTRPSVRFCSPMPNAIRKDNLCFVRPDFDLFSTIYSMKKPAFRADPSGIRVFQINTT